MLPTLTRAHVDSCRFERWYPSFQSVTFDSKCLELPSAFIEYLHADGLVLPGVNSSLPPPHPDACADTDDDDDPAPRASVIEELDSSDDESDAVADPALQFPDVLAWIESSIESLGGAVLPKLNWSAPKDAVWIMANQTLKSTNAEDIVLLLKSSDYIAHDLGAPYEACDDGAPDVRPDKLHLVLREWFDLQQSNEFRCFVRNNCLIGISQRDHLNYYDFLPPLARGLRSTIADFFYTHVANVFPERDFCFDVYLSRSFRRVYLMDFNPFGTITEPLLFEWPELAEAKVIEGASALYASPDTRADVLKAIDVRMLHDELGIQPSSSMLNRLPKDFVDLSTGEAIEAFAVAHREGTLVPPPIE